MNRMTTAVLTALTMFACTPQHSEPGPQGEQGPMGPKGATGDTGPQGPRGLQGEKGDPGDKGEKGEAGTIGPQGPQGVQGLQGTKGEQGPQGVQGLQGIQGIKGDKGDTGSPGAKGEKGDKGDTGLTGAKGDKGDKGDTGAPGVDGVYLSGSRIKAKMLVTPDGAQQFVTWHDTIIDEDCAFLPTNDGTRCVPDILPGNSYTGSTVAFFGSNNSTCALAANPVLRWTDAGDPPAHVTYRDPFATATTYRVYAVGTPVSPAMIWWYRSDSSNQCFADSAPSAPLYELTDVTSSYVAATVVLK